jgi:GNAT superfamily N-acetyltransferase
MLREIEPNSAEMIHGLAGALSAAGLPTDDLGAEPYRYFAWGDEAWGGLGAGEDALVRSVIVRPEARGRGVGTALVEALVAAAQRQGTQRLWLLTTDAAAFFGRLGWREAERSEAPATIASARQFTELCPASASLMVRVLS